MDTKKGNSSMTVNELKAYLEQIVAVESNLLSLRSACETLEVYSLCYKTIGTKADYSNDISDFGLISHISDYQYWLRYNQPNFENEVREKCLESYLNFLAFSGQNLYEIFRDISSSDSTAKKELFRENYQAPTVTKETIPATEVVHAPEQVKEVKPISIGKMLKHALLFGTPFWITFEFLIIAYGVFGTVANVASFLVSFLIGFLFSSFFRESNNKEAQKYSEYLEQKKAYDLYVQQKQRLESEWRSATRASFDSAFSQASSKASEAYEKYANARSRTVEEETANLKKSIAESEAILQRLYDMNVLYPKYRTFTAESTILEYFETGRCTELTGPNGAYNLYESELRQNLIIMKLDEVIHKLDELKSTMYLCCRAIENTGKQLRSLQRELEALNNTVGKQLEIQQQSLRLNSLSLMYTSSVAANTEAIKYISLLK